jgi:hypothetical protein
MQQFAAPVRLADFTVRLFLPDAILQDEKQVGNRCQFKSEIGVSRHAAYGTLKP